jgi:prepilin-type processing-associated H-X9-DG protein
MAADSEGPFLYPSDLSFANYPGASAALAANAREFWPEYPGGGGPAIVPERDARHQMGQNAVFFDGHARWLRYQRFVGQPMRETIQSWLGD